jgi:hypothetical protein
MTKVTTCRRSATEADPQVGARSKVTHYHQSGGNAEQKQEFRAFR